MAGLSWVYLIVMAVGSWVLSSWSFAWAVLAGGIISITSFLVSYRDVMGFLDTVALQSQSTERVKKIKKSFIVKFWLRLFLIGLILFLLIRFSGINVFGLILGLSTVVFTITFAGLGVVWRYYFSRR
ncbi:MAG: ATP synthase subunit I [Desulfocapsaceae bacterium]